MKDTYFKITGDKFNFDITPNCDEWYLKDMSINVRNDDVYLNHKDLPKGKAIKVDKRQFLYRVFNMMELPENGHDFIFSELKVAVNVNPEFMMSLFHDSYTFKK